MSKSVPLDQLEAVPESLLEVGKSLPYDLYNARGNFLSAQNYIFRNEMEVAMVLNAKPMRLKLDEPTIKTQNSEELFDDTVGGEKTDSDDNFDAFDDSLAGTGSVELAFDDSSQPEAKKLKFDYTVIEGTQELINLFPKLFRAIHDDKELAIKLLKKMEDILFHVIAIDYDAAIGVVHMTEIKTQAEHCVFAAILAAIYSRTIGYPDRFVRLVANSAICMNMGAIKLHHQLNSEDSELSEDMLSEIRRHSEETVNLIAEVGIRHPTIKNAILHHHERPDGSGYPLGLHSVEIPDEALIIGIVDTYLAMIGPRAYRKKIQPKEALKAVLFEGHKYDSDFYTSFIKAIGVFPAGTFHELTNGDIVVIARRDPEHSTKPVVCRLKSAEGYIENTLKFRKLAATKQTVKAPFANGMSLGIRPTDLWKS
ncbi:HD domain-containing protein [Aliikangiella marina]|uniref:HD domain-containing protein n=1 Tax=Aliikangiella marina TaxID=1712262 RepID=A0A545T6C6_9GAMM|nr:HD domain-containing phosphohydrolase [Aliikangiella marina]TQV72773.1 HD domain-containing protein [Aliikangiella marina]